ncbi:MAG: serine/threonine-protein kinase [Thermofilaceae archaeon]
MDGQGEQSSVIDLKAYEWDCPHCRRRNSPFAKYCMSCGQVRPGLVYCEDGHANPPFYRYCSTCGKPLVREAAPRLLEAESFEERVKLYVGRPVRGLKLNPQGPLPLQRVIKIHDEYECRSYLAVGGFAATLLGVDGRGVSYALKIPAEDFHKLMFGGRPSFYPQLAEEQRRMFAREREVLERVAQLDHPCIVRFVRALEASADRPLALVFEYCEGGSLRDLLQRGPLGPRGAAEVVVQIADALRLIHSMGYVHGDVKPENILFTRDGIPRLADFNTARLIEAVTRSRVAYTPGYAAPEQVKGGRPSQKSDVWSLALVLYEAATGRPLLPLEDLSYQDKLGELEAGGRLEVKTGDQALDRIIASCLVWDPEKRPSMEEFERMLLDYLTQIGARR